MISMADYQNVSCFVFEQSIMFHKAAVQNIYNVYYTKRCQCVFSGIWFIVDAMSGNFVLLHTLYTLRTAYKLCIDTVWKLAYYKIEINFYLLKGCNTLVAALLKNGIHLNCSLL